MILNHLNNKEKYYRVIVNELKNCGIKFRVDKNAKRSREQASNIIFSTSLDLIELTDVNLNGATVPIPTFVHDACNFIIANINTEGLFRKAGSAARQKQIRANLEIGHKLGKQHHPIDIANILKTFFRNLREPLIPPGNAQDSMLKCLVTSDKTVDNLLLICLLLPPLTLNTLGYFMQFLKKISENSSTNRMTIENLSIIFAPGLMPLNQFSEERLNGHVKVIRLLIDHAFKIGIIPEYLLIKFQNITDDTKFNQQLITTKPIRKARRSGSLTRMFNGLRKIVSGAGSNENLDNVSPESAVKPCIKKSAKKRVLETQGFSAKKKKNILAMQQQSESLASSTPILKKSQLRQSLDAKGKHLNNRSNTPNSTHQTRRWSFIESPRNFKLTSSSTSFPCSNQMELDINQSFSNEITNRPLQSARLHPTSLSSCNIQNESHTKSDYVKIPVEEYNDIKKRVKSLEKKISEEFRYLSNYGSICLENNNVSGTGPENVQNKFEQILEKTETLNENSISEPLANHLKQELRIKNKNEAIIIRSPSARKIGTIRRRSRELSISATSRNSKQKTVFCDDSTSIITKSLANSKTKLKRGKPNTVTTGLTHSLPLVKDIKVSTTSNNCIIENVNCFDIASKNRQLMTKVNLKNCTSTLVTPFKNKTHKNEFDNLTVPVPTNKLILSNSKPTLRSSLLSKTLYLQMNESDDVNPINLFPKILEQTGRASIAKIRAQNAGMVQEKAKLFNGMSNKGEM